MFFANFWICFLLNCDTDFADTMIKSGRTAIDDNDFECMNNVFQKEWKNLIVDRQWSSVYVIL